MNPITQGSNMLKSSIRLGLAQFLLQAPALLATDPPVERVARIYNPDGPPVEGRMSPDLAEAIWAYHDPRAESMSLVPGAERFDAALVSSGFETTNGMAQDVFMCPKGDPGAEARATTYFLSSSVDGYASIRSIPGADDLRLTIEPGETIRIVASLPSHNLDLMLVDGSGLSLALRVPFKGFSGSAVPFLKAVIGSTAAAPAEAMEEKKDAPGEPKPQEKA
jgi:hypothetical protein